MIKKAYFEITNICNLNCSFCPKTKRTPRYVTVEEFENVTGKLKGKIEYLYLHLMGEPTVHPQLKELLNIAFQKGFKVILTTNGTTLGKLDSMLVNSEALYKVSISLHSREANEYGTHTSTYLENCFRFAREAAQNGKICVFRLWNLDGETTVGQNSDNPQILSHMRRYFNGEWVKTRSGQRLCDRVFLEYGEKFEWPDPEAEGMSDEDSFCHGLRDQIGILSDGTVVPCCLDSEGTINLGNIFSQTLDEILSSKKATDFYKCFTNRKSPTALCSSCGYAKKFTRK